MSKPEAAAQKVQHDTMQRYYVLQSKIYNATRWSFLFGRKSILHKLSLPKDKPLKIMEIGCGTGVNIQQLAKLYPKASLTGWDVSSNMLAIARKSLKGQSSQIQWHEEPYLEGDNRYTSSQELILFSYSLTMINPHWPTLLNQAMNDLKPNGMIAVVDFHDTPFGWFRRHMGNNHVRMEAHLLPVLKEHCSEVVVERTPSAYLGVWRYLMFIGKK